MSDTKVDIKGLSKAAVLQALFNRSKCQGNSVIAAAAADGARDMILEEARQLTRNRLDFDYLRGRVMKVNIEGDEFDSYLFDRDNGQGAAAQAINSIREKTDDKGSTTETAEMD